MECEGLERLSREELLEVLTHQAEVIGRQRRAKADAGTMARPPTLVKLSASCSE